MTTLLFALGGLVVGGGAGTLVWRMQVRALKAKYANVCPHTVWSPWEDCTIYSHWGPIENRRTESRPAQERVCMACGEKQVREVKPTDDTT